MISSLGSQGLANINKTLQSDKRQINKTNEVLANDKISVLSEQIKNGNYKIDLNKTATAIAKELMG